MRPLLHPSEQRRIERKELHRVNILRKSCDAASYLRRCQGMCIEEGLHGNGVRRVVWRHVILGLGALRPVPYVEDAIARRQSQLQSSNNNNNNNNNNVKKKKRKSSDSNNSSSKGNILETVEEEEEEEEEEGDDNNDSDDNEEGEEGERNEMHKKSLLEPEGFPDNCQPRVIHVDLQRSLWLLYPESTKRDAMREVLKSILLRVLASNAERYYYQGLHELMGFVMYVMEGTAMEVILAVCEKLLQVQWRSFSDRRLNQSQSMLYAVHCVVAREDVKLAMKLESCGVAPESHYAVAWLITWYSHVCEDVVMLARLFDFLVGHNDEHAVIFFTAALVLHERDRILNWIYEAREGPDKEEDEVVIMARVYTKLTRMPKEVLTIENSAAVEEMMRTAVTLRKKYTTYVQEAREDFLQGRVTKLGMLADKRTRNSALRLLWDLLFREWRKPWKERNFTRPILATVLVAVIAITLRSASSSFYTSVAAHVLPPTPSPSPSSLS